MGNDGGLGARLTAIFGGYAVTDASQHRQYYSRFQCETRPPYSVGAAYSWMTDPTLPTLASKVVLWSTRQRTSTV